MADSTAFNNMIDNPEGPAPSDSVPLIVGASVGGLCCILLTASLIAWLVRRRQLNASNKDPTKNEYFDASLAETAEVPKNTISIYAAMPQIDTPDGDDTTSQIVYGVAPTDAAASQSQIYGAAPPMMNT